MPRLPRRCVAVLGADGTGATELAQALAEALRLAGAPVDVVLADTAPLLATLNGHPPPEASSLHAPRALALQHTTRYSHTLLMGLDLPWVAEGAGSTSAAARDQADARLRHALGQAGISFQVVYGQGAQRLQNALSALGAGLDPPPQPSRQPETGSARWAWACDKCSDPACEHRLFTGLAGLQGAA